MKLTANHSPIVRLLRVVVALFSAMTLIGLALYALSPAPPVLSSPQAAYDLEIDKLGPETILAGARITYTLRFTNNSNVTLNGVRIVDTWSLPDYDGTYEDLSNVVSSTLFVTQPVGSEFIQFNIKPMPPGQVGVIRVGMLISTALQPDYALPSAKIAGNNAIITTTTPGRTANNKSVNTTIVGPVLRLFNLVEPPAIVRPGRLITFDLLLHNQDSFVRSDSISGTNVIISNIIPPLMQFWAAYPVTQATYSASDNAVQWLLPLVKAGTYNTVTLVLRAAPTATWGAAYNLADYCKVTAAELPKPVQCINHAQYFVDDVFEKTAIATKPPYPPYLDMPYPISATFPSRVLTYTVYAYNPFTQTVSLRITDTLPRWQDASPTTTFRYVTLTVQPNPPTLVTVYYSNVVVFDTPPIAGWGIYSFTFSTFVPPTMPMAPNQVYRAIGPNVSYEYYGNTLEGSSGNIMLPYNPAYAPAYGRGPFHDLPSFVVETPQILVHKTVTPTAQIYGLPVLYALTLTNTGTTTVRNINLTDLLPNYATASDTCAFQFGGPVSGQPPASNTTTSATWTGITLTAGAAWTTYFTAVVRGNLNSTCYNSTSGSSPDSFIVAQQYNLAPVIVQVPFRYNKTVQPTAVVLGGQITYTVSWYNIGGIPATLDGFTDTLPSGFLYQGNTRYTNFPPGGTILQAYNASAYTATFAVDVVSRPLCDALPEVVVQPPGSHYMHISAPPSLVNYWSSTTYDAPVVVLPQVVATKLATPTNMLPGDTVTFTIVLSNNTANPVAQVRITDTFLTAGSFKFNGMLGGGPTPVTTTPDIIWNNQTVPGGGKLTFSFTATAPITIGNGYKNIVKAESLSNPLICIPKAASPDLNILPPLVNINKNANVTKIGPLGKFYYRIYFTNRGPYPVTILRFTDTLPGLVTRWTYDSMYDNTYPQPISTNPPVWQNITVQPLQTYILPFYVRVGTELNTFYNLQVSNNPPLTAGQFTATVQAGWSITTDFGFLGAPVEVEPGVGLNKIVGPEIITNGGTVVYTITLVNLSQSIVNNVRLTDTLPSGFTFDSMVSTDPSLTPISTTPPIWAFSILNIGEPSKKEIAFRVTVAPTVTTGTYYNRLDATADNILIPPTGDLAPVYVTSTVGPPAPDLRISKSDGRGGVLVGDLVTYTIRYTNTGGDIAQNIRLTETLPNNMSFVGPVSWTFSGGVYIYDAPNLASGQAATAIFVAQVTGVPSNNLYTNTVTIAASNETNLSNNQAIDVDQVQRLDVSVSKSDGVDFPQAGQFLTYTITFTNVGNDLVNNVVLTETPSTDVTVVDTNWTNIGGGLYVRTGGALNAGQSATMSFVVQINANVLGVTGLTNSVSIGFAGADADLSNNTATDSDTITPANLDFFIDDGVGIVDVNQALVYTLTARNIGNSAATGVTFIVTPPAELVISSPPGWTPVGSTYQQTVPDVMPNTIALVTFLAQVQSSLAANTNIVLPAAVVAGNEDTPANNGFTDTDIVHVGHGGPDIIITGARFPSAVVKGQVATIQITVTNIGNQETGDWFFIDTYVDHQPINRLDLSNWNVQVGRVNPNRAARVNTLQPNETRVIAHTLTISTGGAHQVYLQADTCAPYIGTGQNCLDPSYARIAELNEANNIYGPLSVTVSDFNLIYLPLVMR